MTGKERVLSLLRKRGDQGLSQVDFLAPNVTDGLKPYLRVAARIFDLREEGYDIGSYPGANGCDVYVLLEEPARVERAVATDAPTVSDGPPEPGPFDSRTFDNRRHWEDAA